MAIKGIDYVLSLNPTKYESALGAVTTKTKAAASAVSDYWKKTELGASKVGDSFVSMRTKVAGAIAAIGGVYAVGTAYRSVVGAAEEADKASFNLGTSVQAANREFRVGDAKSWQATIKALAGELKIYSTSAITEASAKTIDMTKRLGLNQQEMVKVLRAAANLSAGKFELADGVERVTAALRGEAEASEALGLTLNENYVKGWYEARGATQGAWKDLTDLEKAHIRLNVLLQQSDPLLGKAAASAGTYGGALSVLSGNFDSLKASVGETVTRNSFVVESIGKISTIIKALNTDVDGNRLKWMQWTKDGVLATVDFGVATLKAASSVYSAFLGIKGGLQEVAASYYAVKQAALEWSAFVTVDDIGSAQFARDAAAAGAKANELSAASRQSFAEMDAGAPKVLKAAESLQKFREELDKIQVKEINVDNLGKPSPEAEQSIVRIGDKWVGVAKEIEGSNKDTSKKVADTWEGVWEQVESGALESVADIEKALQALTKDRTVTVTVRQVEKNQSGGLIGAYKFGGLIQALAAGGSVRNILSGGHLPGFGGGDRRLLLGEDGEVMLNKYAVRAAGLKAALAFNAGRFDVVLDELRQRVGNTIGFRLGGLVDRLPKMQSLANGGAVAAGSDFGTINLSFPSGASVPVQTTRELARTMLREFDRMGWRASA